jgi:hypothetical protein
MNLNIGWLWTLAITIEHEGVGVFHNIDARIPTCITLS